SPAVMLAARNIWPELRKFRPGLIRCRIYGPEGSLDPSHELGDIYGYPGMRADPDLFVTFGRPHCELDLPPVQFRDFGPPPLTRRPAGVAARWRTSTAVPTGSRRFARCSGWTRGLKGPLAPKGICLMVCSHKAAKTNRDAGLPEQIGTLA